MLRALAEVNTRRRAERDLDKMRQDAITKFAGDMLNVADKSDLPDMRLLYSMPMVPARP